MPHAETRSNSQDQAFSTKPHYFSSQLAKHKRIRIEVIGSERLGSPLPTLPFICGLKEGHFFFCPRNHCLYFENFLIEQKLTEGKLFLFAFKAM